MEKWLLGLVVALAFCLYLATSADNVEAGVANRSEIRALFVHYPTYNNNPDWDQVLQTVQDTNHNVLIMEILGNSFARYPSQLFDPSMRDHLGEAIQAGHSRGIEVHALMLVSLNPPDADPNLRQVSCDGSYNDWLDPCLPESRQLLKEAVEELVTNYDIDGFMFDYIRYNTQDASVSDACRQKFEAETGITPSNWPAEVCGGGQYNNEFMIWRIDTITELVADMRGWMIEIDPELEFSAAAFQILYENGNYYPTYTRRAVGQDPTEWIEMGLMDWVSPMGYTNDPDRYAATHSGCIQYMVGGPEGAVPIAAFTANDLNSITVSQFQQEIAKCREIGCDGWAIWRYGGPGDNSGMTPDIRDYFDGVSLPDTFSIGSVQAFVGSTDAVVSWKSDKPVDGTVEYSTTPLFVATAKTDYNYQCSCQFPYYDMEHNQGDVVTDSSLDTTHAITLLNLQPSTKYYYRIQSTDESGTATSKVYEFTTSSGTATVTITGKVTDSETGQPIEGATVSCGPNGDLTDQAGDFSIGKASTGTCTLTAEKRGYVTYSTGFDYPSSGPYTHDIPLDPQKIHIIGSLVDEQGSPVQANVTIYEQGTDNVIAEVQTDPSGSYDIPIIPDVYDVKLRLAQVSFRVSSVDSFSELRDLINGVSHTEDRTALTVDIPESEHTIQIETNMPQRVFINGSRIAAVSSLGELKRNTYFYSNGILYLKIHPDLMSDCIYECCENEQRYYDKPCGVNEYCSANNCGPKIECPYECCEDEAIYLNKSCAATEYCSDNVCLEYAAYWGFDEGSGSSVYDSSGNDNTGSIIGAAWSTDCISGSCLQFDGVDDSVDVPDSESLNIDGPLTVEAWVKLNGPWNGDYPGVVAKYWPNGYLLAVDDATQKWGFWLRGGGSVGLFSDDQVEFGGWKHMAITYDGTNMRMYVNGTLQSSTRTFTSSIDSNGIELQIGRWGMRYLNANIDEVRVYRRALTEAEVQAHANV